MRLVLAFLALGFLAACNDFANDGAVETKPPKVETATTEVATDETAIVEDGAAQDETTIVVLNENPDISNTQDFTAVTEAVTAKDDEARIKAASEVYTVVEKTALPKRKGKSANVVQYALATTNEVGEKIYKRGNPLAAKLAEKNCRKYKTADIAQLAFLEAGGPKRDSRSLDPDGDGFACDWTPETYRKLVN
ncbi:MAG: hypothetical protein GXP03_11260 [Alphaproteobacteria bacterium]|nr:hypothetical protein [Alphaproteobacteria bacterium]